MLGDFADPRTPSVCEGEEVKRPQSAVAALYTPQPHVPDPSKPSQLNSYSTGAHIASDHHPLKSTHAWEVSTINFYSPRAHTLAHNTWLSSLFFEPRPIAAVRVFFKARREQNTSGARALRFRGRGACSGS